MREGKIEIKSKAKEIYNQIDHMTLEDKYYPGYHSIGLQKTFSLLDLVPALEG